MTFYSRLRSDSYLTQFLAYLYVISGLTFYFGTIINPILYNLVSNKYRRAFRNLICCRFRLTKPMRLMNKSSPEQHRQLRINYAQQQQQKQQRQTTGIVIDSTQRLRTNTNTSSMNSFKTTKRLFPFLIK